MRKKLLQTFNIPYALLDETGRLIWMNEAFMEVTGRAKDYHKSITTIFPQITRESFEGEEENTILEYHVEFEEHVYKAQVQQVPFKDISGQENIKELWY